jgi:hypothetical protein
MSIEHSCVISISILELIAVEFIFTRLVRWVLQNESSLLEGIPLVVGSGWGLGTLRVILIAHIMLVGT